MPGNFIEIKNLSKEFKTDKACVVALDETNFDIKQGEFVTVVGPSGCGKSTLLKIVSGLYPSTNGEVLIDGKKVKGPQPNLGIVFQNPALLAWRRIFSNILLPIEILKLDVKEYEKTAKDLIHLTGLEGFEERYPYELSGGMQQRVAICRALIHDPPLLLMDEPFGALDAFTREAMNIELMRIWDKKKKTVMFITHSISEAVFLGDRTVVMTPRPGKVADIVDIDLPRPRTIELFTHPTFGKLTLDLRKKLGLGAGLVD